MAPTDRRDLASRLLAGAAARVPTGAVHRLSRTALAAVRAGPLGPLGKLAAGGELPALDEKGLAAIERLVKDLGELKGIAMKVGQVLSYVGEGLPPEAQALLGLLRTASPPTAFAEIERTLRDELGEGAEALLATLERTPVASASIGQVHRALLPDGTPVAVKVRHPGIEDALRSDFRAAWLGPIVASVFAPGSDVGEAIEEVKAGLLGECDYRLEAARQARFAALHVGHERLRIPAVHEAYVAPRVLVTTWCEGRDFEAYVATDPPAEERAALGRALYEFYVGTLYRHGLFNADPHPGNLLFADGRVTVLDHGCVREFDRETVAALVALRRAVQEDRPGAIREALARLGAKAPAEADLGPTRDVLRGFFGPLLEPGVRRVQGGMNLDLRKVAEEKRRMLKLRLPGKLLFLLRIRFGLYAVLARLGADLDLRALEDELATGT